RGWLVSRLLLISDTVGFTLAFFFAELWLGRSGGRVTAIEEELLFLATLPVWILVAKLLGLYDQDEERTDHSTVDDISGVFHLVTIAAWVFYAGAWMS